MKHQSRQLVRSLLWRCTLGLQTVPGSATMLEKQALEILEAGVERNRQGSPATHRPDL